MALQVSIRFFTFLREITGKKKEEHSPSKKTKKSPLLLPKQLSEIFGKHFAEYVYDRKTGEEGYSQFFLNGQSTAGLSGL
jgi:molybdopterin converting factor small subunit